MIKTQIEKIKKLREDIEIPNYFYNTSITPTEVNNNLLKLIDIILDDNMDQEDKKDV